MPRKARLDAPGALHHVIGRGIERRKIFRDDADHEDFLERLGNILHESGTPWALSGHSSFHHLAMRPVLSIVHHATERLPG